MRGGNPFRDARREFPRFLVAGSFSCADGHSEFHKWRDPRTAEPKGFGFGSPNNVDSNWLQSKSSVRINRATR